MQRITEDKVLALIPAYNEANHIPAVVSGVKAFLPVLVVDDGSIDETAALAGAAGADVIRQSPNQGKGTALRAGFRWALEKGYDAVLTLDADGQHDPLEIPKFLAAFENQRSDLIIGARGFSQIPPVRRLANTLGRWMLSWALGQPIPDNQSGYRLISKRLIEVILGSNEQGFEYEVEMIAICIQRGYSLSWVPIRTIYAGEVSHIKPSQHVKNYLRIVWKVRKSARGLTVLL